MFFWKYSESIQIQLLSSASNRYMLKCVLPDHQNDDDVTILLMVFAPRLLVLPRSILIPECASLSRVLITEIAR